MGKVRARTESGLIQGPWGREQGRESGLSEMDTRRNGREDELVLAAPRWVVMKPWLKGQSCQKGWVQS